MTAAGCLVEKREGQLWVPPDIQPDTGSAAGQIEKLVAQVVDLYKIAVGEPL